MRFDKIMIYHNGEFLNVGFSSLIKPIILVGSGRPYSDNFPIGENVANLLKKHNIPFVRTYDPWPKDLWVYHNGVYIVNQVKVDDSGKRRYQISEGGNYVFGNDFCFVSEGQIYQKNQQTIDDFINEIKVATGVSKVFLLPYLGHKHIDLIVGFIPWLNLFVFDETYFRVNKFILEPILTELNSNFILTNEKYASNFFVFDYSLEEIPENLRERFVITYNSPRLSKKLEKLGVNVLQPENTSLEDLSMFGGVSCTMNIVHDVSLISQLLIGSQDYMKRVYINNPHLNS